MSPVRLLKSAAIYPDYLAQFYAARPGLADQPYEAQYRTLMADSFTWADAWERALVPTGGWQVREVIPNAEPMQRRWAAERGLAVGDRSWVLDVLTAQLEEFRPDIYFQHGFAPVTPAIRRELRRRFPGIRLFVGYDGIGRHDAPFFAGCDVILSNVAATARYYDAAGFTGLTMKLGFDAEVLRRLPPVTEPTDVSFVGGIALGRNPHLARLRALAAASRRVPLALYLALPTPLGFLRGRAAALLDRRWHDLAGSLSLWRDYARVRAANRGARFGLAMYQALASSRITLNIHIDTTGDQAVNMRLFEATGVGTCLLTDRKGRLEELFDVGREIVVFDGLDDMLEKMQWLLDHEPERAAIARAGQARTLRDHALADEIRRVAAALAARL